MAQKNVLLVKSEKPDDPYMQILAEKGFIAACVPSLAFQYINLDILEQRLLRPSEYSGLILTSQNSVEACHQVNKTSDSISGWIGKLNYTVGEATQLKAKTLLGLECRGADTGNSDVLVDQISEDLQPEHTLKFLYPKTSLKTIDLKTRLKQRGFDLDELEVYNTLADPDFNQNLTTHYSSSNSGLKTYPDFVVYFSPSGVDYTLDALQNCFTENISQIKFVAVGPSTSLELTKRGVENHGVLAKPTPQSLIECILERGEHNS